VVPETHNLIAALVQTFGSTLICLSLSSMLSAIELNYEVAFRATEIHNVTTDGMLAAELTAVCLAGTQPHPELAFSVGLIKP
jgi:hypothetical protein